MAGFMRRVGPREIPANYYGFVVSVTAQSNAKSQRRMRQMRAVSLSVITSFIGKLHKDQQILFTWCNILEEWKGGNVWVW